MRLRADAQRQLRATRGLYITESEISVHRVWVSLGRVTSV